MAELPSTTPTAVFSARQVREMDRIAIEEHGIAGFELMSRAGQAALDTLGAHWPDARRLLIYCGAGNNAGDGYVLARLAAGAGLDVELVAVTDSGKLTGDAATAWRDCRDAGIETRAFAEGTPAPDADVVVDAVLGTGLDRELAGPFAAAVAAINRAGRPVLALDIPTGLAADTGHVLGAAVKAAVTITFVGRKAGLYLGLARDYCGEIEFSSLAIPVAVPDAFTPVLRELERADIERALPRRRPSAHKGDNGRVLVIGGGPRMGGAIRLAAEAALRTGAGLVYAGTHPESVATVMAGRPEIICYGVADPLELADVAAGADAVVIGPGLGQGPWSRAMWRFAMGLHAPLVVDADGLNLLADQPLPRENWILTPHPGEAARLAGTSVAAVAADRLGTVKALRERFAASVVLKGANTLVGLADPSRTVAVCAAGNAGMGTAGMGDVLAGVLGAVIAQCRGIEAAAGAAVLLHALAGDAAAAAGGERGLLASDLMPFLRECSNTAS
jgi:hydroxyethylthiazole kinase-like uncharacterized protein yjeF